MHRRAVGPLVFLSRMSWDVELCKCSNSARNSGVKSQACFENVGLWLTQCLIAQTFSFLKLRLPEHQQENSLTMGAGRCTDNLFVTNLTYLLFQQLKDTKQVRGVWGSSVKNHNFLYRYRCSYRQTYIYIYIGFLIGWNERGKNTLQMSRLQGTCCMFCIQLQQSWCLGCS